MLSSVGSSSNFLKMITIDHLPDEVLALIFSAFPDFHSVGAGVAQVCKHWSLIARDTDIWHHYWVQNDLGPLPSEAVIRSRTFYGLFKENVMYRKKWLSGSLLPLRVGRTYFLMIPPSLNLPRTQQGLHLPDNHRQREQVHCFQHRQRHGHHLRFRWQFAELDRHRLITCVPGLSPPQRRLLRRGG